VGSLELVGRTRAQLDVRSDDRPDRVVGSAACSRRRAVYVTRLNADLAAASVNPASDNAPARIVCAISFDSSRYHVPSSNRIAG
jgi:hypothetical protein